jgi:hypothetical protein
MKKYINPALRVASLVMLLYIIYNQKQTIDQFNLESKTKINNCDSIKLIYDSLKLEMFSKDIEIGRYQMIIDRIPDELNPDCQLQFEKLLHETE